MPQPPIAFEDDGPQLPTINAPGGLPFLSGGAAQQPASEISPPRKADIVTGGRGGGSESGGEFDRGSGGFGNG